MNRLQKVLENKKTVIPFIVCGNPDLETTERLIREESERGAVLIELGIPFSDPTAEGTAIQEANIRALAGGVTTDKIFAFVKRLRAEDVTVPFVFRTYANVVFSYGAERFMAACRESGVEGIDILDLPFEEKEEFLPFCRKQDVTLISTAAPAAENRIAAIAKEAEGFLCIMPGAETHGRKNGVIADVPSVLKTVRAHTNLPCIIGVNAVLPENEMLSYADGVVSYRKAGDF